MSAEQPDRASYARPGVPDLLADADLRAALDAALEAAGAPPDATVSLTLSDDAELAALNAEHMGKDGPTDVLSFPLLPPSAFPAHPGQDPAAPGDGRARPASRCRPASPSTSGTSSCPSSGPSRRPPRGAAARRATWRWQPADELRLLVTHGALHLCGWDHAEPQEEAAMRALERRLLGLAG